MTAKKLFSGTMPFVVAKLALGGLTVLASVILLAILMGIGWLFGDGGIGVALIIWIIAVGVIRFALMHYMGYMVKAGHIAVIAEAMKTGSIPNNQVEYGKNLVKERFATSNIYFGVDKLVTNAVKQIQRVLDKAGNALDFIPGMDALTGVAKFFVEISLGYIDECCFGWTFYNKEQGACKSAADGVVIYAQNWKVLLKNAAKTMLKTILLMVVMVLVIFIPVGLIFKLLDWSGFAAFLLACLIAWVVKFALLDSYLMIQMMTTYMEVAPKTVITFDLYSKLCTMSASFKELFQKGQKEAPAQEAANVAGADVAMAGTMVAGTGNVAQAVPEGQTDSVMPQQTEQQAAVAQKPIFCGQCGTKNAAGTKFCGSCGAQL